MPRNNGSPNGTTDSRRRLFLTLVGFLHCFPVQAKSPPGTPRPPCTWRRGHPGGRGTRSGATARPLKGTRGRELRLTACRSGRMPGRTTGRQRRAPQEPSGSARMRVTPGTTARRTARVGTRCHRGMRRTAARGLPRRPAGSPSGPCCRPFTDDGRPDTAPARPWYPPAHPAAEIPSLSPAHSVNKSARTLPRHRALHGQTVATAQLTFPISLIPHRRPFAHDTNETSPPEQKWLIQDFSHRCRKREREKSTHYWQVSLAVVSDSYPWKLSRQFGVATVFTPSHTIATPQGFTECNFEPQLP